MRSNMCFKYNHPTEPKGLICADGLTLEPLFLGRLRPERLTSNQIVSQHRISFAWRHKQPIYFFRPKWAGSVTSALVEALHEKPNIWDSDHVRHNPTCTVTEEDFGINMKRDCTNYRFNENKDAYQLCSYCTADLRLCFHICRLMVFLCDGSVSIISLPNNSTGTCKHFMRVCSDLSFLSAKQN